MSYNTHCSTFQSLGFPYSLRQYRWAVHGPWSAVSHNSETLVASWWSEHPVRGKTELTGHYTTQRAQQDTSHTHTHAHTHARTHARTHTHRCFTVPLCQDQPADVSAVRSHSSLPSNKRSSTSVLSTLYSGDRFKTWHNALTHLFMFN